MIYFLKIKQCDCTDNGKVLSWTVATKSYNLHGQQYIPMTCLDATILYDQWQPGTSVPVFYKVLTGTCWLGRGICNSLSSTHPCMVFLVQRLNSGFLVNPADAKKWIQILTVSWLNTCDYVPNSTYVYSINNKYLKSIYLLSKSMFCPHTPSLHKNIPQSSAEIVLVIKRQEVHGPHSSPENSSTQ